MLQHKKEVLYNGFRGTVTSTFELFTKDEEKPGSIGRALEAGQKSEAWENSCTGEEEIIDYEALLASYPGLDPNKAFLKVSWEFIPYPDEIIYPSDMAENMLEQGWERKTVQDLLDWEKTIRNTPEALAKIARIENENPIAEPKSNPVIEPLPSGKPIILVNPFGNEDIHVLATGILPPPPKGVRAIAAYPVGTRAVVTGEFVSQDSSIRYPVAFADGVRGWLNADYIVFK